MNILCMCKKKITQHTIMHLKNTMAPPEADLFLISRWPLHCKKKYRNKTENLLAENYQVIFC